jgi:hypothetical protein
VLAGAHADTGLTAELVLGDAEGTARERDHVWPVQLIADGTGSVTAIQIDLDYDLSDCSSAQMLASQSAMRSDESASFSTLFDGTVRTVGCAKDQTTIPGAAVFEIQFDSPAGAAAGSTQVAVKNPIASEKQASEVIQEAGHGTVAVAAAVDVDSRTGGGRSGCFIQTALE